MTHDPAAQRAATEVLWAEITGQGTPPDKGMLDLHFVAGAEADATEFMGWLEDHGYDVEHYEADEDEEETIEAQTPEMRLSLEAILEEERRTTEAALGYGYRPTGWGVMFT
ncbi:hypothetical protein JANAI62_05650 [Jannaschia pagri]|uniref:Regulator of ribonuclease activity B domain-containing protein n=1 Tax=Jannaschia pagri TaxID=2829797 RepID=A0ABQ4NIM1_9RHOB|nr:MULTISPECIES: ribonuclease E inhibitor RraB [unclassified Jannaschia]GIT89951.1 hypothetical protein JANAI61_04090 [Jannaschia sp. AI_61]GIT93942.1 hypothetical protein JANAI62_05650 [Jannaschia sp. AI_62]